MKNFRLALYRIKRKIINSSISLYSWPDKLPYYLGLKKADSGSMPEISINAREYIKANYDSNKNIEKYEELFVKLLGESIVKNIRK